MTSSNGNIFRVTDPLHFEVDLQLVISMLRFSLGLVEMYGERVSYSIILLLQLTWQASLKQIKRLITVNTHYKSNQRR